MNIEKKNKWLRFGSQVGVAAVSAMLTGVVLAGSNSTSLPNGASMEVSINDPVTSTEFKVPAGDSDIDVEVHGDASIGLGEPDNTAIYIIDESGSVGSGSGTGCSPILNCEKDFFHQLNAAFIADGSTDLAAVVYYENGSRTAQGLTSPGSALITSGINSGSAGGGTNCAAGLSRAFDLFNSGANNNGNTTMVFASDGECNVGNNVSGVVTNIRNVGIVLSSVAIGTGSNCTSNGGQGTLNSITANGGTCTHVPDPGNLPDIIDNLIGSTLDSLQIEINGGGKSFIPNSEISQDLPQAAIAVVDYWTDATNLGPADHTICVTANGSDVTDGTADVTQCETIHLLQLTASPATEDNELNTDVSHTVTAAILGGTGSDRNIDFLVSGTNTASANPGNGVIQATPGGASVDFIYTVPQVCASLGTDTITVTTTIAGMEDSIALEKNWIDTVPPNVSCDPTVNPNGNNEPTAPGNGGKGQNQDGYYQLNTDDGVLDCTVTLVVTDGDGFVFAGPFNPGDNIKYTQDDDISQEQKKIGSTKGNAGAVTWHLIGHGDLTVTATDTSGNIATASCLVPPKPQ